MSAETQKVDVLLAFDNAATHFHWQRMPSSSEEMRLARAAVAELIEAARFLLPRIRETNGAACVDRMESALAKIGGEK